MFPLYLRQKHLRDCREHFWSPLYAACIIAIWFITLSLKFFREVATLNHNKEKFPYILLLKHFQSTFWDGCTLRYFWWIIRTLNNHQSLHITFILNIAHSVNQGRWVTLVAALFFICWLLSVLWFGFFVTSCFILYPHVSCCDFPLPGLFLCIPVFQLFISPCVFQSVSFPPSVRLFSPLCVLCVLISSSWLLRSVFCFCSTLYLS